MTISGYFCLGPSPLLPTSRHDGSLKPHYGEIFMRPKITHDWDLDPASALALQHQLAPQVITHDAFLPDWETLAGVDLHYHKESDRVVAGVVVLDRHSLAVVEAVRAEEHVRFPYVPGLFSFREIPPIISALNQLKTQADVLVCDAQGLAHPRRFGLACHLGVLYDIPTIGCGKSRLTGTYQEPGQERGSQSPLLDEEGGIIGSVLRTQTGVKPIFVSIGHRLSLETASDLVLRLATKYRLPESTRKADHWVRHGCFGD